MPTKPGRRCVRDSQRVLFFTTRSSLWVRLPSKLVRTMEAMLWGCRNFHKSVSLKTPMRTSIPPRRRLR